jgi:secondary thiamine-phosphate synthase enzyme
METPTALATPRYTRIRVATSRPVEFIDLTDRLARLVADSAVQAGILSLQTLHTTTAVLVNEHERLLLDDFRDLLDRLAPDDGRYAHDDTSRRANVALDERANGHAHCRALLLPTSVALHIADGRLVLGRWQRLFLLELDGPQEREISTLILGEGGL